MWTESKKISGDCPFDNYKPQYPIFLTACRNAYDLCHVKIVISVNGSFHLIYLQILYLLKKYLFKIIFLHDEKYTIYLDKAIFEQQVFERKDLTKVSRFEENQQT